MPVPRWMATVNKRVFNPMELRRGRRPVLTHVGRVTGVAHHTPLDAHLVEGGFIFVVVYGAGSDWVRNILAAGSARLAIDGTTFELTSPEVMDAAAAIPLLPPSFEPPPGFLHVTEYLRMAVAR